MEPIYPDQIHLLTVFHEIPHFRSHLLPHAPQVPEHTKLLKGPVDLNTGAFGKKLPAAGTETGNGHADTS